MTCQACTLQPPYTPTWCCNRGVGGTCSWGFSVYLSKSRHCGALTTHPVHMLLVHTKPRIALCATRQTHILSFCRFVCTQQVITQVSTYNCYACCLFVNLRLVGHLRCEFRILN
eukprot:6289964-Amphidinium_carterae.1